MEVTALGSITTNKASGGDEVPVELFQILKDDAITVMHSPCQQIWKTEVATGLEKVRFHSNPKERQCQNMFKLPNNCSHLSSVQFSCSVMSESLRPPELQHTRPSCPTPTPGAL